MPDQPSGTAARRCHECGTNDVLPGDVSSGYPDHIWRTWCRACLAENRRAYQEARRAS